VGTFLPSLLSVTTSCPAGELIKYTSLPHEKAP
jgi:hypothetical protein